MTEAQRGRFFEDFKVGDVYHHALVGRSLAPKGTLIVAGDQEQQIDESACFRGWEHAMRELSAALAGTKCSKATEVITLREPPRLLMCARTFETIAFHAISTPTTTRELAKAASPIASAMLTAVAAARYAAQSPTILPLGVGLPLQNQNTAALASHVAVG